MSNIKACDVAVGDVLYRAEAMATTWYDAIRVHVVVETYTVTRITDSSYWIQPNAHCSALLRRSRKSLRPWARHTEAEAMEHLRMRSRSRYAHASLRLAEAQAVLRELGIGKEGDAP